MYNDEGTINLLKTKTKGIPPPFIWQTKVTQEIKGVAITNHKKYLLIGMQKFSGWQIDHHPFLKKYFLNWNFAFKWTFFDEKNTFKFSAWLRCHLGTQIATDKSIFQRVRNRSKIVPTFEFNSEILRRSLRYQYRWSAWKGLRSKKIEKM